MSFGDMVKSIEKKKKIAEERYKTGLCAGMVNDGKNECTNPHTGDDGLCDSCRKEVNALLRELSRGGGFFGIKV